MIVSSLLKFCVLWGKVVLANKQTKTLYKLNSNKTMNSVKRLLILKNPTKKIKNSIEPFKSFQTLYLCHNLHFMIQGFVRSFITKSTFIYNSCWPLIHKHSYSMIIKEEGWCASFQNHHKEMSKGTVTLDGCCFNVENEVVIFA